jgi:glycosyltransferase involved in cell wall biosynthesis
MLTDLAEDLAAAGWKVTVVASRSRYRGTGRRFLARETRNGVSIVRISTTRLGENSLFGRAIDFGFYFFGSFWHLLCAHRPDVIAAMSDPPLIVVVGLAAARLRGSHCVYWVQDLFPQIAARLGVLSERGLSYRILRRVAAGATSRCDLVVALGERMAANVVNAAADQSRTIVIHNWADCTRVTPVPPAENPFVTQHGLEGKFVVLYSGNAGRAHVFESTIEAARRLASEPDITFLFIGGGPQVPQLRRLAREGIPNIRFLDYVPRDELRFSLSAASVSLVTENPAVAGLVVPSKVYGILASGRPMLFVGSDASDVADLVRRHECGIVVDAGDAEGLVAAIRRLRSHPNEVVEMGSKARAAAERFYDRRIATKKWDAALGSLASTNS